VKEVSVKFSYGVEKVPYLEFSLSKLTCYYSASKTGKTFNKLSIVHCSKTFNFQITVLKFLFELVEDIRIE